ncbi:MAG: hypothetical protein DRJ05_02045 [Bacteroidetes bacterium]|nr:MAG: hypothetical protein DRJ05_02045 [Bacteroidota bacterium]
MKKKYLLLIVAFVAFGFSIKAQSFNGGVLGGVSGTQISGDDLSGFNKGGLYIGAFVNRYFGDKSSLQMELDFIQKGSRKNPNAKKNDYSTYLLRLNYIEIPVSYKYDFSAKGTLEGGLSLGVLVNSYEEANETTTVSGGEFNRTDFSFHVGGYYTIVENLRINVRYSSSILPVRDHSSGATDRLNAGQYNSVLSFILFYGF